MKAVSYYSDLDREIHLAVLDFRLTALLWEMVQTTRTKI